MDKDIIIKVAENDLTLWEIRSMGELSELEEGLISKIRDQAVVANTANAMFQLHLQGVVDQKDTIIDQQAEEIKKLKALKFTQDDLYNFCKEACFMKRVTLNGFNLWFENKFKTD